MGRAFQVAESRSSVQSCRMAGRWWCVATSDKEKLGLIRRGSVTSSSLSLGTPINLFGVDAGGEDAAPIPRWEL